jgi:hypothetical protein
VPRLPRSERPSRTGTLERFHVEMNATSAELVDFFLKRARTAHAAGR